MTQRQRAEHQAERDERSRAIDARFGEMRGSDQRRVLRRLEKAGSNTIGAWEAALTAVELRRARKDRDE